MAVAAEVFLPRGIDVTFLGTVPLPTATALGQYGLLLALIGILFAVGGATIETSFSGAYNVAQFFGWEWGKYRRRRDAPRFTLAWLAMLLLALVIAETGVDPVLVTEYSVIFSVVALPLTYLPILLIANDEDYMGEHRNGRFANALGWTYFGIIIVIAVVGDSADADHERRHRMSDDVLLDKQVLDHQLLDCHGRRCGNVDDLELDGRSRRAARRRRDPVGTGRVPDPSGAGRPAGCLAARAAVRSGRDAHRVERGVGP